MAAGDLLHDLHGQLIMITGHIDDRINRCHFMLGRRGFVMLGLRQDAQLPELLIQLGHKGLNAGLDGAEEMISQLLPLGRPGTKESPPCKDQIAALIIEFFIDQKVLLLRTNGGHDPGGIHPAKELQYPDSLPADRFHGAKKGRFFIQGFATVGTVGRRNTEGMILDKGIGSRIPGGVAAGLEGGAKTAAGQTAGIRFAPDQLPAAELIDHPAARDRRDKSIMLFGGDTVQRLEPMGVMGGAALNRPVLHGVRHHAGHLRIQAAAVINRFMQGLIGFPGQTLPHHEIVEDIDPEGFFHDCHGGFPPHDTNRKTV